MLDVRRMRVLRAVEQHGSIAAAADALSLTPSAASQHIAMLERETGVALVERGPRSIRLTEAGRALVEHTDRVIGQLTSAEADIRAIAGLEAGSLRLASFATAGATLLAEAVSRFRAHHPRVVLSHVEGEPDELIEQLVAGNVDVALIYEYDFADARHPSAVELVHLLDDPILVALPADHRLAAGDAVALEELSHETWVAGGDTTWCTRFTERFCRAAGYEPAIEFRTDDYGVACALVGAGVGVAFVPELAMSFGDPSVVARPIAGAAPVRTIYAAHRVGAARVPAVAAMVATLAGVSSVRASALRSRRTPPELLVARSAGERLRA